MQTTWYPLLLVLFPFVAGILLLAGGSKDKAASTRLAFILALVQLGLSIPLLFGEGMATKAMEWFSIAGTTVTVQFAADGLSSWLVHLVALMLPVALLSGYRSGSSELAQHGVALFFLSGAMIGALLAADLVMFYLFYEAMLIPTLFMVVRSGDSRRLTNGLRFTLYTIFGSIFMLVAIWVLAAQSGTTLIADLPATISAMDADMRFYVFAAFSLAFAVKVPLLPFHSWQAPLYSSAPIGALIMITAVMAKLGVYGFMRFVIALFPDESVMYASYFIWAGGIGTVLGALIALVQSDVRRLLAFSSLSHLGLIVVGLFSFNELAFSGALVQMLAHGFSVAALFIIVAILESRAKSRDMYDYGSVVNLHSPLGIALIMAALCSVALPGTASFVGEFLILAGMFQSSVLSGVGVAVIGTSVILGAGYMLRFVKFTAFGKESKRLEGLSEEPIGLELCAVFALIALSFFYGIYSSPMTRRAGVELEELSKPARQQVAVMHSDMNKNIAQLSSKPTLAKVVESAQ